MSKKNTRRRIEQPFAIIIAVIAVLLAMLFLVAAGFAIKAYRDKNQITSSYSHVELPADFTLQENQWHGFTGDSDGYWSYYYKSPSDADKTAKDLQTALEKDGFTISDIKPEPGGNLNYTFSAKSKEDNLGLIIYVSSKIDRTYGGDNSNVTRNGPQEIYVGVYRE